MNTCGGTFICESNSLRAVFIIDGVIAMKFTAKVTPVVSDFDTYSVMLTYDDFDDLTSKRSYHGRFGVDKFKITLKNGPVIEGTMIEHISPAVTVTGTGTWESD
ncbi:hypothetical protein ABKN59_005391 [Abortiporus biennis]